MQFVVKKFQGLAGMLLRPGVLSQSDELQMPVLKKQMPVEIVAQYCNQNDLT